jgi:type IV pilus assembly protein PilW
MMPVRRLPVRARQAGFTIVEMMVALGIGLVVVLGLAVAFVNMKSSFATQDKLTQLQDGERLALGMLIDSLQESGYFPDPTTNDRATLLPISNDATYGNMDAGQAVMGVAAVSAAPESLSTRYASSGSDTLMNCVGSTLPAGAVHNVRNVFYVDASTSTLACMYSIDGGAWVKDGTRPFTLVSGVKSMSVLYGLDTDGDGSVDQYLGPASVTTALWDTVRAVRVSLYFADPNDASKQIRWDQTINLMNFKS